ncbi:MAG: hypothetical protein KDD41_03885, partial [Flavobacteriales bacterium]|nr:hypothetical protein [Flavobacteriales bacterium]
MACQTAFGQKKFFASIDSSTVAPNKYMETYAADELLGSGLGDQEIELDHFDEDLLEALILSKINAYRSSKNKSPFIPSKPIQAIADAYIAKYHASSFKSNGPNYYKLKRVLNRITKFIWLNYKLYDGFVHLPVVADYKRGAFYYDKEADTDLKL